MTNNTVFNKSNFYSVAKKLSFDYRVDAYHIENLLHVALDNSGLELVSCSFNKLMDVFYRDCESVLLEQMYEFGLAA